MFTYDMFHLYQLRIFTNVENIVARITRCIWFLRGEETINTERNMQIIIIKCCIDGLTTTSDV